MFVAHGSPKRSTTPANIKWYPSPVDHAQDDSRPLFSKNDRKLSAQGPWNEAFSFKYHQSYSLEQIRKLLGFAEDPMKTSKEKFHTFQFARPVRALESKRLDGSQKSWGSRHDDIGSRLSVSHANSNAMDIAVAALEAQTCQPLRCVIIDQEKHEDWDETCDKPALVFSHWDDDWDCIKYLAANYRSLVTTKQLGTQEGVLTQGVVADPFSIAGDASVISDICNSIPLFLRENKSLPGLKDGFEKSPGSMVKMKKSPNQKRASLITSETGLTTFGKETNSKQFTHTDTADNPAASEKGRKRNSQLPDNGTQLDYAKDSKRDQENEIQKTPKKTHASTEQMAVTDGESRGFRYVGKYKILQISMYEIASKDIRSKPLHPPVYNAISKAGSQCIASPVPYWSHLGPVCPMQMSTGPQQNQVKSVDRGWAIVVFAKCKQTPRKLPKALTSQRGRYGISTPGIVSPTDVRIGTSDSVDISPEQGSPVRHVGQNKHSRGINGTPKAKRQH